MNIEKIELRKLVAGEGMVLVSKETQYDEELEKDIPLVKAKEIYLGKNDSEDNYYEEVEELEEN